MCSVPATMCPSHLRSAVSVSVRTSHRLLVVCALLLTVLPIGYSRPALGGVNSLRHSARKTVHQKVNIPSTTGSSVGSSIIEGELIKSAVLPISFADSRRTRNSGRSSQSAITLRFSHSEADILNMIRDAFSVNSGRFSEGHHNTPDDVAPAMPLAKSNSRSSCHPKPRTVTLNLPDGCQYEGKSSVPMAVNVCGGVCRTSVEPQAVPVSEKDVSAFFKQPKCRCCQPKAVEYKEIVATCPGNDQRVFKVASALGCRCKKCRA